jgi:DNA-binding PadR family transcriptional regulator
MSREPASVELNTTSYAVLGLLNLKPWTAYELAAEMHHCFDYFWYRADSRTYAEAERLVSAGMATSRKEMIGRRPRTTYSITARGRRALRQWLAMPPTRAIAIEFEGLVRVFLAKGAGKEELLATLDRTREWAEEMLGFAEMGSSFYFKGEAPFQAGEGHLRALVFTFMVPFGRHLKTWAEAARAEVESWPDLEPTNRDERCLALIRGAFEGANDRAADHSSG